MSEYLGLTENMEIEAQIIGRMIRFGDRAHEIISRMSVEQFYSERHRVIFEAIAKIAEAAAPSLQSIAAELDRAKRLESIGGAAYLMEIVDSSFSMVGADSDINAVQGAYKRRQTIEMARALLNDAVEAESADDALASAVARLSAIVNGSGGTRSGFSHAASNLDSVLSSDRPREIPTGLEWFDEIYTPRPGNYIVLAGF